MKQLIGTKIEKIELSKDGQYYLQFTTDKGIRLFGTEGDCCSESWFADIIGTNNLLGATVAAVEEVEMPNYNTEDGRCRQEVDSVYGYKLTTSKGYADIIFRNSSNGYYGGSLTYEGSMPSTEEMEEITQDYPSPATPHKEEV